MYQSRWADPPPAPSPVKSVAPISAQVDHPDSFNDAIGTLPTIPSVLSPAAPAFAPYTNEPPPDVSTIDSFAPTGAQQSDLFDDVMPEESMRLRSDDDLFNDDFTPAAQPVVEQAPSQPVPAPTRSSAPQSQQGRGRGDGLQGRGRGRGRAPQNVPRQHPNRGQVSQENTQADATEHTAQPSAEGAPRENTPTAPREKPVLSVRGDRRATGGVRKPRLTEDELAAKMASISIKNASLTAAHARAEADAASFAERESQAKVVAEKRKKAERKDRQQMMGEREKNRARKLKAMEGREWDAEKREEEFGKGGKFDKLGGFAGDQQEYSDGREYLYQEPRGGDRGRGGGGRGARVGRPREVAPPKPDDFPALPAASKDKGAISAGTDAAKPSGKSWAEEMETAAA